MSSGVGSNKEPVVTSAWGNTRQQLRSHFFRAWTACAVLAGYIYSWLYAPELLTWWKRTTTAAIEAGCGLLPYPWGDRVEATLGNFGLWVQITIAIIAFRALVWLILTLSRRSGRGVRGWQAVPERQVISDGT